MLPLPFPQGLVTGSNLLEIHVTSTDGNRSLVYHVVLQRDKVPHLTLLTLLTSP